MADDQPTIIKGKYLVLTEDNTPIAEAFKYIEDEILIDLKRALQESLASNPALPAEEQMPEEQVALCHKMVTAVDAEFERRGRDPNACIKPN